VAFRELSRLEWYQSASQNLHRFLSELEAELASVGISTRTNATNLLIVEVKRRLLAFDKMIAEESALLEAQVKPHRERFSQ